MKTIFNEGLFRNIFNNETYEFWRGPGVDPTKNKTECFLLPAAATMEKEGSQSNSGRWVQWKYKAAEAPGDALPVGEIEIKIMSAVKKLFEKEGGPNAEAIVNLNGYHVFTSFNFELVPDYNGSLGSDTKAVFITNLAVDRVLLSNGGFYNDFTNSDDIRNMISVITAHIEKNKMVEGA